MNKQEIIEKYQYLVDAGELKQQTLQSFAEEMERINKLVEDFKNK